MAFRKPLAERLFNVSKISSQVLKNCRVSSPRVLTQTGFSLNKSQTPIPHDPGDNGNIFRRFLHRKSASQQIITPAVWIGDSLVEKIRELDISKNRIQLNGLIPPPVVNSHTVTTEGFCVEDVKKLLKAAQLELVKSKLREMDSSWITFPDFVRICIDVCSDQEQGNRMANTLDESGAVIVLGNHVLLKPEQVAKLIGGLIPLPLTNPNDPRRKELKEMEKTKAEIDKQAASHVRRELWGGLGYIVIQTAAFMRLTFWELSWDVMEPICFYVTSIHVMAGYCFFLRTSKEPTFESLYRSRFNAKQKRIMKIRNFDSKRYNELRRAFDPYSLSSSESHHDSLVA